MATAAGCVGKQLAPAAQFPTIEPEGELIEVLETYGTLVYSK